MDPNLVNELAKAANSPQAKELTLPAAHEIGQLMGDVANAFRFYATRNMELVLTKWAAQRKREGRVIEAEDIGRVMPLLPTIATVSDPNLQEKWAKLLEVGTSQREAYLQTFSSTLSQLSPLHACFLDSLWATAHSRPGFHFSRIEIARATEMATASQKDAKDSPYQFFSMNPYTLQHFFEKVAARLDLIQVTSSFHFTMYGAEFMKAISTHD